MPNDDKPKRGRGRPKGTKASAAQKAAGAANRKKADKARTDRAVARKAETAALVKPRWKQVEDGELSLSDLTDEELVRGEIANNDGTWEGRRHVLEPRMLGRMNTEYKRRIRKGIDRLGMIAIDAIEDILEDDDSRAQQFAAAKMVVEYNIGKVPEVVHVGAETEWDRMATTAFTILRGEENVVDEPVDEDIVDVEWTEVEA